jgi:hypothetical protein
MFSHICCKCFILMLGMFAMFFKCFCKCFRRMFQVFHLSFLYVASVASECFKSRSSVAHDIRVGSWRGCERSPRVRGTGDVSGAGPAWPRDTGVGEQRSASASPCVDVGKRTVATGVSPDTSNADLQIIN